MRLGTLQQVAVREIWADEARDFTPWLAANVSLLSDAVGIDLELVDSEVPVGPFSADLVLGDTSTGGTVVVENMFGPTDHDHVGKLITYAAGMEATCGVLIAERFRPEHLSALHWLNASSRAETAFFGVEVEVWRIADSAPAPRLNVVAKPDTWIREARPATSELSAKRVLYRDWWSEFLPALRDAYPGWTNARVPQPQNWMNFPAGRTGMTYGAVLAWPAGSDAQRLRVELYIDPGDSGRTEEIFGYLLSHQNEIESSVGVPLEWQDLEERRASRIAVTHAADVDVTDRESWPELRSWAIDMLGRLRLATQPYLQSLPASTSAEG